jgi:hypothetical protein
MTSFFDHLKSRFRSLSAIDPERDWIVLLIIAIISFLLITSWNIVTFNTVASGGVIGKPAATTTPVFSQASLDAIHAVFSNRAIEEAKYTGEGYHYVDPSQ